MQIGSEPIANKGGEDGGCVGCGIVSQSAVVYMEPSQAGWFLFVWFFPSMMRLETAWIQGGVEPGWFQTPKGLQLLSM